MILSTKPLSKIMWSVCLNRSILISGQMDLGKADVYKRQGRRSAEKFIALVDKYQTFEELTTYMLNEFVEKIVVHERDRKGSVETTQEVEIYFNFIGRDVYKRQAFSHVEKKYHVDFALKKDTAAEQPRYLVFFKSRDADAITAAFQEFASRKMSREEKLSIRERLTLSLIHI